MSSIPPSSSLSLVVNYPKVSQDEQRNQLEKEVQRIENKKRYTVPEKPQGDFKHSLDSPLLNLEDMPDLFEISALPTNLKNDPTARSSSAPTSSFPTPQKEMKTFIPSNEPQSSYSDEPMDLGPINPDRFKVNTNRLTRKSSGITNKNKNIGEPMVRSSSESTLLKKKSSSLFKFLKDKDEK